MVHLSNEAQLLRCLKFISVITHILMRSPEFIYIYLVPATGQGRLFVCCLCFEGCNEARLV